MHVMVLSKVVAPFLGDGVSDRMATTPHYITVLSIISVMETLQPQQQYM